MRHDAKLPTGSARRARRDRGQMRRTERDLTLLPWIGEQYAMRFDHRSSSKPPPPLPMRVPSPAEGVRAGRLGKAVGASRFFGSEAEGPSRLVQFCDTTNGHCGGRRSERKQERDNWRGSQGKRKESNHGRTSERGHQGACATPG